MARIVIPQTTSALIVNLCPIMELTQESARPRWSKPFWNRLLLRRSVQIGREQCYAARENVILAR